MWLASGSSRRSTIPIQLLCALTASVVFLQAGAAVALPPVLTVPGPRSVVEGDLLQFNIQATDPEGQTIYLFAIELPAGASFQDNQNNTGSFSWTPGSDQAGSHVATFLADDTFGGMDQES